MAYRTELMEQILTSKQAQLFIDKMAPIYGNAYTFLWILQSVCVVLDDLMTYPEEIKKQVTPQTATWTLDFWEKEYGIATDPSKTIEQRQQSLTRIIRANARNNPKTLEDLIQAITGYTTKIVENVAKNTFRVEVYGYVDDTSGIVKVIEKRKPAHLIYELVVGELLDTETTTYSGVVGLITNETYGKVEVIN